MLGWAVWFKFLFNKVIANTCLFILTSFSKQSSSSKVLEICELCALSTDSQKAYWVNKHMYTGSSGYSLDWGGGGGGDNPLGGGGGDNGKDPKPELFHRKNFPEYVSIMRFFDFICKVFQESSFPFFFQKNRLTLLTHCDWKAECVLKSTHA